MEGTCLATLRNSITDYPHSDHAGDYMRELLDLADRLPADARRRLLGANAAEAYRLD